MSQQPQARPLIQLAERLVCRVWIMGLWDSVPPTVAKFPNPGRRSENPQTSLYFSRGNSRRRVRNNFS